MAQLALGVVGGVVGFVASGFNPYGAAIGFSVGMSIGGVLAGGVSVPGNTLGDIATQTAKEGVARPIIWGRVRPIAGNLIACSEPKIVKEKHSSGGKGGGGATTTSESVYRTYAIRVCEGPITRFVRIWRNNELVYDNRPVTEGETVATSATTPTWGMLFSAIGQWGEDNNSEFLKNGRLYLGGWDQMPDSALEGIFGAGNVPAHRGTAYMVMDNELLNDTGGAVPQWTFEVERAEGIVLTSKLYSYEIGESVYSEGVISNRSYPENFNLDEVSGNSFISSVEIRETLKYINASDDLSCTSSVLSADLRETLKLYGYSESVNDASLVTSGTLYVALVNYSNAVPEKLNTNGAYITSGTLT